MLETDDRHEADPEPEITPSEPLQGWVDEVTSAILSGWAWDSAKPNEPVVLQVFDNEIPILRVVANRHREHLEKDGVGDGRHSFYVWFPGGLSPLIRHVIAIRHARDGREVPNSPFVLEPSTIFDPALEGAIEKAVEALTLASDQTHALSFLAGQTERLLQKRAETEGQQLQRLAYRELNRRGQADTITDPGLRALVVDDEVPVTGRDAGSSAIVSHMYALQRLGYAVTFVAARQLAATGLGVEQLEAAGITCCRLPYYASVEEVLVRQHHCFDLVYLHRLANVAKYLSLVREYSPRARVLYSVADLHHLRVARQAEIEERPELMAVSRRMRLAECTGAFQADAVLTHSIDEAEWLRKSVPDAAVYVTPWSIMTRPVSAQFSVRGGVAFIGGYRHPPNIDAACFLVEEIMPLVWRQDPAITCLLVGSDMPERVKLLAQDGVEIVGQVDTLAEIFERVRLTVAPLRYGAGIKGKVLESFAAGIPCVMSRIAAEGIPLHPPLDRLVGTDAEQIAARIVHMHSDELAAFRASDAGLSLIDGQHSEEHVVETLRTAIDGRPPVDPGR